MGRDMVAVKTGNISIEAGGDGIKSTNDADALKGGIALEGGSFNIKSKLDGIQAETSVLITGGSFTISSGGGNANGIVKPSEDWQNPGGGKDKNVTTKTTETEVQSAKGIKASVDIAISGCTFKIDSSDDAVHCNNSVIIAGGDLSIASGDDGSSTNVRPGENNISSTGDNKLNINGGYVVVNSTGDGLDSNGSIYMTAGTVIVSGPTANNNGALDMMEPLK